MAKQYLYRLELYILVNVTEKVCIKHDTCSSSDIIVKLIILQYMCSCLISNIKITIFVQKYSKSLLM